jgi:hypothetical protein
VSWCVVVSREGVEPYFFGSFYYEDRARMFQFRIEKEVASRKIAGISIGVHEMIGPESWATSLPRFSDEEDDL